ncbi:MAG: hypothetical protein M1832_006083 [Thelocarpon impressellum]|nr:MAG: hypothetical protein M1832_006083 [Thelocarpon impressellum]
MAATEPRLEALLVDPLALIRVPKAANGSSLELPPLQASAAPRSLGRPSPLEPNASADGNGKAHASGSQHLPAAGPGKEKRSGHRTVRRTTEPQTSPTPVRQQRRPDLRLGLSLDPEHAPETQAVNPAVQREHLPLDLPLSLALGPGRAGSDVRAEGRQVLAPRKRQKPNAAAEPATRSHFMQLPKPPVKKSTRPARLPTLALLNGLKTPPPNAALFPPIAAGTMDDECDAFFSCQRPAAAEPEPAARPPGKSAARPDEGKVKRRKWTERETEDLLQGVAQHGIGRWKKILVDPAFRFDARTSIDLKDRFRTCCPAEYKRHLKSEASASGESIHSAAAAGAAAGASDPSSNTPTKKAELPPISSAPAQKFCDDVTTSQRREAGAATEPPKNAARSRSHRLTSDDLARLGIAGPFPKVARRERRPFTAQEDADLSRGYATHGPAWSRIQADQTLDLANRRATDLRDRFRNRYPERYAEAGFKVRPKTTRPTSRGEDPSAQAGAPASADVADTRSDGRTDENANDDKPHDRKLTPAKLDPPSLHVDDHILPPSSSLIDWGDATLPPFANSNTSPGEQDMQRLLLDHVHPLPLYSPSPLPRAACGGKSSSNPFSSPSHPTSSPSSNPAAVPANPSNEARGDGRKPSMVNLPPPTDLLPLDFDAAFMPSTMPSSFAAAFPLPSFSNGGGRSDGPAKRPSTTPVEHGSDAGASVAALISWEDMATHPMFDIDTPGDRDEDMGGAARRA